MPNTKLQLVPTTAVPQHVAKTLRSSNLSKQHFEEVENLINKSERIITEVEAQMDKIEAAISKRDNEIRALRKENRRLQHINEQAGKQFARTQVSGPNCLYGGINESRENVIQADGDVIDATSAVKELQRQLAESRAARSNNHSISTSASTHLYAASGPGHQQFS